MFTCIKTSTWLILTYAIVRAIKLKPSVFLKAIFTPLDRDYFVCTKKAVRGLPITYVNAYVMGTFTVAIRSKMPQNNSPTQTQRPHILPHILPINDYLTQI